MTPQWPQTEHLSFSGLSSPRVITEPQRQGRSSESHSALGKQIIRWIRKRAPLTADYEIIDEVLLPEALAKTMACVHNRGEDLLGGDLRDLTSES